MTARDVIAVWTEECAKRAYRLNPPVGEFLLSALAAAGLAIYDTRTHAAVPREASERMCSAGIAIIDREYGESNWETAPEMAEGLWPQPIYAAMVAAAEAEAKETGDVG